jgi:hypothetical protein
LILPAITAHVTEAEPEWWTDADAAEWDCLALELALGSVEHHEHCPECARHFPCARLARGFELADEWLAGRRAQSRAAHLRAQLEAVAA